MAPVIISSLIVLHLMIFIGNATQGASDLWSGAFSFEECVAEMSSDKPFKTYEQQIELLKEKGLSIPNETYAVKVLKDLSYFALINGYKKAFKQDGLYENASFEDIVALFKFDEKLRGILLKYILIIERKIKSSLSYHFSQKYPKCQEDYLNVNNYSYECVKIATAFCALFQH